jgi:Zn-dependent M28 family amino/carboxypeptidase
MKTKLRKIYWPLLAPIALFACAGDPSGAALAHIDTEGLGAHIATLASDEFEGRAPSSPGEEQTVTYLRNEFQRLGLEPGNGESWYQDVPLVAITVQNAPALTIRAGGRSFDYGYGSGHVSWTKRVVERSQLSASEMVFVGYGIVAPEYDWNDYEGVDASGKTVVMLVNDPGFATQDSALFNGNTMTYYGRWTYKFEEAARQGAAGAIIIHETGAAGYPWDVVRGSWTGPQFDLVSENDNMGRVAVEGWLTSAAAREVLNAVGQDLDVLAAAAAQPGFRAVELGGLTATVSLQNGLERSESRNVIGVVPGTSRSDEYVFYMAHWDHFGRDTNLAGDQIYNGAFDNATGTAGLIELAEAFASLDPAPARSVVFLAVTAEEQGLLGSAYYATNPVYPTSQTVAAINMDGLNIHGPMRDITVVGLGNSELDDYLRRAADEAGRIIRPDPEPEKGFYYRSDHFSFAKVGIPALYPDAGIDHVEHGEAWTMEQRADYTTNDYHKPSDEYDPNWDLRGAVDDLQLMFRVGYEIAISAGFPNWTEGTEFKAIRDADLTR